MAQPAWADYSGRADVEAFIKEVATRNQLEPDALRASLSRARYIPSVITLITPPSKKGTRSWQRYRGQFLDAGHINAGLQAWRQYESELRRAEKEYGVPPEVILGILGVETIYGRNMGNFEALSALSTLAFDYPPRAALFRGELEALFLLAREQKRRPESFVGSFAGAIGWPQFLPSSVRKFGVDFDGDGKIDFNSNGVDAIGSIANYFVAHGWQRGAPVAIPVQLDAWSDPLPLIAEGIEPTISAARVSAAGIRPFQGTLPKLDATLVDLETPNANTEYWLGYRNFYVITRYNKSSFYAMAVYQLSQTLRDIHDGKQAAPAQAKKAVTPTRKRVKRRR